MTGSDLYQPVRLPSIVDHFQPNILFVCKHFTYMYTFQQQGLGSSRYTCAHTQTLLHDSDTLHGFVCSTLSVGLSLLSHTLHLL